jgi:hypothetical protein
MAMVEKPGVTYKNRPFGDRKPVIRSSPVAGLCYDTPSVEAMPFLIGIPDTLPHALSSDLYQEKLPSQPLGERLRRNIGLLYACIQEKSPLKPLFGFHGRTKVGMMRTQGDDHVV